MYINPVKYADDIRYKPFCHLLEKNLAFVITNARLLVFGTKTFPRPFVPWTIRSLTYVVRCVENCLLVLNEFLDCVLQTYLQPCSINLTPDAYQSEILGTL